jgi:hypothetical protein
MHFVVDPICPSASQIIPRRKGIPRRRRDHTTKIIGGFRGEARTFCCVRVVDAGGVELCCCVVGVAAALAGRVGELRAVSQLFSGVSERAAMLIMGGAARG